VTDERWRLAERRPALEARARVRSALRRWFEDEGFLEVETPARVPSPGQEPHLDAIPSGDLWLVTSPEYAMKRLCAAGYEKIVSMGKCWRADERGPHHEPEFTMIEWYRANEPLARIADDCEALVRLAAAAVADAGADRAAGQGVARLPDAPFARVTVREVMDRFAGLALDGDEPALVLAAKARGVGIALGTATEWDDIFFQVWLDRVEPRLAELGPVFVFDWPAPLGALARRRADDPRFVERFELYAQGIELANAFGELTDPLEQRARFEAECAARRARGKAIYPIDERLLAALPAMPATAGVALGFDRLVMLVLGAASLADVTAFAADEI
jgi:lysyl-tRNA synthetase class 2